MLRKWWQLTAQRYAQATAAAYTHPPTAEVNLARSATNEAGPHDATAVPARSVRYFLRQGACEAVADVQPSVNNAPHVRPLPAGRQQTGPR
ncbi:hypothetical protein E6Q11_06805 [Candidatus Dojkabacteria bacterium]|uniref:Uncharacterized protein n=1 Tax=Candidatus Dojkabacteria bacterium TaxID=2099670 RepID=A0A5C7J4F3_9BACT|nr:MAG: hypothetical protein E6Q11_06805 [Candidatus Dojkabacteria bacterium]